MLRSFASGTIFGARTGDGAPTVLALPGWDRTHTDFDTVLAGLDAIALDLPGWGASPPPPEAWGTAEYAAAVREVVVEMATPVVVVGHSFGGRVAVRLAASSPDLVLGLVLTGVPLLRRAEYGAKRSSAGYRLARFLTRVGLLSDARMQAMREARSASDWKRAQGVMRDVFTRVVNESYEDELRAIRCPVDFVWGKQDTAAPVAMANEAARLVSRSRLIVIDGADHFVPLKRPQALRHAIDGQLGAS